MAISVVVLTQKVQFLSYGQGLRGNCLARGKCLIVGNCLKNEPVEKKPVGYCPKCVFSIYIVIIHSIGKYLQVRFPQVFFDKNILKILLVTC
jgi:hypothetical protein